MTTTRAALLPLADLEITVVLDALVAFANTQQQEGDPLSVVDSADEIADRVRGLMGLAAVEPDQWLRALGLGRYKRRPQG